MGFLLRLRRLPTTLGLLWAALRDRRTPLAPRAGALLAALYLVFPFDFIPDFIPFAGLLDEVIVIPLLLGVARRMIPAPVLAELEARQQARPREARERNNRRGWIALGGVAVVLVVWAVVARWQVA